MIVITKGYFKVGSKQIDANGKIIKEEKAGWVYDLYGTLWAIIDTETEEVLVMKLELSEILEKFEEIISITRSEEG